ncbi:MAG TPA: DUF5777 family beta-barrel protein [Flavisolibacter sp.]|nr:DUF5777 family beta-barrel protein [Flavisolibacter sp.]
MKRIIVILFYMAFGASKLMAQEEDLLSLLGEEKPKKENVFNAFKSARVIMSHSMEMLRPGVLDFRILHRFGRINGGAYELFGLDGPATVRLALDYGVSDYLTLGLGRSTQRKELDGFIKFRPLQQAKGKGALPFSLLLVAGATLNGLKWSDTSRKNFFSSRLAYYGQLVVGSKINDKLSLQLMPSAVHQNLVPDSNDHNDLIAAGIGTRIRLSRRVSLNVDYYHVFNPNNSTRRYLPLSLGFDIETGGHVFQLHFTNAKGMNERAFITDTEYSWGKGEIMFGFNISRSFQIRKKKH